MQARQYNLFYVNYVESESIKSQDIIRLSMEDYMLLLDKAYREAKIADHMMYVTSKMIKDKRLLVSVLNHVRNSFIYSIRSFLLKERAFRRIAPVPSDELLLVDLFFDNYSKRFGIDGNLKLKVRNVINAKKAYDVRGMLLERSKKYIFIGSDYSFIEFNLDDIRSLVKEGLDLVSRIREEMSK